MFTNIVYVDHKSVLGWYFDQNSQKEIRLSWRFGAILPLRFEEFLWELPAPPREENALVQSIGKLCLQKKSCGCELSFTYLKVLD